MRREVGMTQGGCMSVSLTWEQRSLAGGAEALQTGRVGVRDEGVRSLPAPLARPHLSPSTPCSPGPHTQGPAAGGPAPGRTVLQRGSARGVS